MLHLRLSGKPFDFPSTWEEITIGQFMELAKEENTGSITRQISILSGLSTEEVLNANSLDIEKNIIPHLEFLTVLPDLQKIKNTIPETITIGGKPFPVIKEIELEPWGCKEVLYIQMVKALKQDGHLNNLLAYAIATYFYQLYHSKDFDAAKLNEFVLLTEQCSFIEAFPVANFFLNKSKNLLLTSGKQSAQNTTSMKSMQEYAN